MKIKGNKIREGKELQANQLYRVETCRSIVFEEKNTNDVVNIHFHLKGSQYGIYGNEYKPPFAEDIGEKKADILVLVIDENDERFSSWIFDVKKTVGGEDVIYHLIEQLIESVRHKSAVATYLEDYKEEQHIGYITRELQRDRIQETISRKNSYLEKERENIKSMPQLIGTGVQTKLLQEEAKLKTIVAFQNDYIKIGNTEHKIEHYILVEQADKFVYDLDVACS